MHYKTRLYLNFGLIALAFMFITILFQLDREKRYKTEEIRSKLAAYSEMIDAYLLQNCDTIEVTHILPEDLRFTIIDSEGSVIFDNVIGQEGIVENIQNQCRAVVNAEKDLCPDGEYYQRFVPVGAVKDKKYGTIVLHRSLNQDDDEEIFGNVAYLTRVEDGKKAVGMARFNITVEEGEAVVIDTYKSKTNPFKREPVRYRGSREMLSFLDKFLKNPKVTDHLTSAYICLLRTRPLR